MSRAWKFQDSRQNKKLGASKCPWSVGCIDPDGRRRSKRIGSKSQADRFARKLEGQLEAGLYEDKSRISWAEFRQRYEEHRQARKRVLGLAPFDVGPRSFMEVVEEELRNDLYGADFDREGQLTSEDEHNQHGCEGGDGAPTDCFHDTPFAVLAHSRLLGGR